MKFFLLILAFYVYFGLKLKLKKDFYNFYANVIVIGPGSNKSIESITFKTTPVMTKYKIEIDKNHISFLKNDKVCAYKVYFQDMNFIEGKLIHSFDSLNAIENKYYISIRDLYRNIFIRVKYQYGD